MKLLIEIPEGLKKDFELEQWTALSCMEMKNALINGTPIPDNATNEELLLALYKDKRLIDAIRQGTRDFLMYQPNSDKWVSWLDAPYKGVE